MHIHYPSRYPCIPIIHVCPLSIPLSMHGHYPSRYPCMSINHVSIILHRTINKILKWLAIVHDGAANHHGAFHKSGYIESVKPHFYSVTVIGQLKS
ncbi:hypothetical protein TNIN_1601 [Trichonephila inaurata madagascariensis]|uniref:Uncharacterized protein n=1 Tax=Trichonephila inaurata madagascariensis TaxID=2747483 RepID=A0A8X6XF51_9ARAC|nr:hypothetical protein TNIN_1601 [Trichonephila inaurata madagascariensis]